MLYIGEEVSCPGLKSVRLQYIQRNRVTLLSNDRLDMRIILLKLIILANISNICLYISISILLFPTHLSKIFHFLHDKFYLMFIFIFAPTMTFWWRDQGCVLVCRALLYVDLINCFTPRQVRQLKAGKRLELKLLA